MTSEISGVAPWRRSRIVLPVAAPAAGADWTLIVPAGHLYRVLSVYAQLVTSAVVNTRVARLALGDGVRTFLDLPPAASQAASLTRRYAWAPGVSGSSQGTGVESYLPDVTLSAGWTIGSVTDLIDVGDTWTGILLNVIDTTARDGSISIDSIPDLVVEVVDTAGL